MATKKFFRRECGVPDVLVQGNPEPGSGVLVVRRSFEVSLPIARNLNAPARSSSCLENCGGGGRGYQSKSDEMSRRRTRNTTAFDQKNM